MAPISAPSPSSPPPRASLNVDSAVATHPKVVSFRRTSSPGRASMDRLSEQSPLLRPRTSEEVESNLKILSPAESDDWEEASEETKSSWYLLLLTLGGLGLQIGWSVETSHGSPYLLSLGISKSLLALVWIAGPLSGTLVQPYVGLKSDNCRIRWGKRRPFIVGGALATMASLMLLAWSKEIVGSFLGMFGADKESTGVKICIIMFAVLFVYVLDFAINVIQAGIRAYIVDCAPTHQQEAANAWVIRTSGVGNILGYLAGYVDLPRYLPWLGDSQFKVLCAIASFTMAVTVGISCATVHERDPRFEGTPETKDGLMAFFRSLYRSVRKLPPQIRKVCQVQFAAWIGWFPFLFYITTYIGEIYVEPFFEANPDMADADIDKLWEDATRMGTLALLIFAVTTFAASIFLPFIVPPTFEAPKLQPATPLTPTTPRSMSMLASSGGGDYFALKGGSKSTTPKTLSSRLFSWLSLLQIQGLTLRRAWFLSHLMFAALMWATFLVHSVLLATILVSLVGIPWALTNWAPFALISSEISKRDAIRRGILRPASRDAALIAEGEDEGEADQAGVVLGIHNVAIAAPQVIATLVSSLIFRWLQKPRGSPGDNSVAWVLRLGGCCAVVAAWLTLRVGEEKEDVDLVGLGRRLD
ncbi:hypothetical protein BCR34DRAFT_555084 [Clohesyomyces aquaticus]|uniref:Major facilitator superfamily domain-containing protein n=1 Tax=Clohesyomyces aquaticus TaxID=1231657 RepID=A0A1Y2A4X6_9PLEO|nr:hypothetical protein BCR34DRAFT_555084 [Clohesyomyces aquaticus]